MPGSLGEGGDQVPCHVRHLGRRWIPRYTGGPAWEARTPGDTGGPARGSQDAGRHWRTGPWEARTPRDTGGPARGSQDSGRHWRTGLWEARTHRDTGGLVSGKPGLTDTGGLVPGKPGLRETLEDWSLGSQDSGRHWRTGPWEARTHRDTGGPTRGSQDSGRHCRTGPWEARTA